MSIPRRKLDVVFAPGALDGSVDPRTAVQGTMVEASNAVRLKANEWRKRSGSSALSSSPLITGSSDLKRVWQLAAHKGGLVSLSKHLDPGYPLFVQSATANRWGTPDDAIRTYNAGPVRSTRFALAGDSGPAAATAAPISRCPDMAVSAAANYAISAWEVRSSANALLGVVETLIDTASERVLNTTFIASAERPRCEAVGNYLLLAYWDTAAAAVRVRKWDVTAMGVGATTATSVAIATAVLDRMDTIVHASKLSIAAYDGAALVYILEYTPAAGASVGTFTSTSFAGDAGDAAAPTTGAIGWLKDFGASGKRILATIGSTDGLKVHIIATAGTVDVSYVLDAAVATKTQGRNVTGYTYNSTATGNFVVIYEIGPAGGGASLLTTMVKVAQRDTTNLVPSSQWLGGVGLAGKAFTQDGIYYVVVTNPFNNTSLQPTYFLMRVDVGAPSGSIE